MVALLTFSPSQNLALLAKSLDTPPVLGLPFHLSLSRHSARVLPYLPYSSPNFPTSTLSAKANVSKSKTRKVPISYCDLASVHFTSVKYSFRKHARRHSPLTEGSHTHTHATTG